MPEFPKDLANLDLLDLKCSMYAHLYQTYDLYMGSMN